MKIQTYNIKGEKSGSFELNPDIFGVKPKQSLIYQALSVQVANARRPIAHTKIRSEVRGGGRKPWRQKGTGRARAGSTRSPIWKGGGIVFGPRNTKIFEKKINKKAKRKALFMVLTSKVFDKQMIVLDKLEMTEIKTKEFAKILKKLSLTEKRTLLVIPAKENAKVAKSARNIPFVKVIRANSLNVKDLLDYEFILFPKSSVEIIEKTFLKKTVRAEEKKKSKINGTSKLVEKNPRKIIGKKTSKAKKGSNKRTRRPSISKKAVVKSSKK
ncbi:MAG: 50S ribosomal protein L4 [uncultured bacterium]|nr:MAG: 50S ribosomal protein L4 [uncultured bacterium]